MKQMRWITAEVLAIILFWIAIFGIPFLAMQFRYNLNIGISDNYVELSGRNDEVDENSGKWIVNVSTADFEYDEEENPVIYVEKGEKLNLILNTADKVHGFAFLNGGIDINQEVTPGKTEIIEFNADETGEYKINCSIYCGLGHHGMIMKIIVL